mgnify:CR=1 FL=1
MCIRDRANDQLRSTITPYASLLGLAGTVIGIIRAVPQLVRLLRARQAFGVSLDSAATSSVVSFGWASYGLLTGQLYVTLATGPSGFLFSVIAVFCRGSYTQLAAAASGPM